MKSKILFSVFTSIVLLVLTLSLARALTITSVNTNPDQVAPGQTATLAITVQNNLDSEVKNVKVSLDFTTNQLLPIAPYQSSSEQSIDRLRRDNEETFNYNIIVLPQAPAGVYKIPVVITYTIDDNKTQTENSVVSVVVNSEPQITVTNEGALVQGMDQKITIKIVNDGLGDIKFVSINAGNPSNAIINQPTYQYIGTISSDDFDSVDYTLRPTDTNAKSITLPLTITYKDATNKDYTKTESVIIPVYTQKEAVSRGIIKTSNTVLYFGIIVILIIIYVVYRTVRRRRKKTA